MRHRKPREGLKVRRSRPGAGLGLFTEWFIPDESFVVEYTGKKLTSAEADELTTKYLFELNDDYTIDGSARSNVARYINHSCDPNCEAEILDEERILMHAVRDIEPGEEITIDYGKEYFEDFIRPIGCKCDVCVRKEARKAHKKKKAAAKKR